MPALRLNRFTAGYTDADVRPDEGQRQIIEAYAQLTPDTVAALPRLATAAVTSYLGDALPEGGIGPDEVEQDSRIRSRLTVGMLGSCQTALVICSADPTIAGRGGFGVVDHESVTTAFEAVAEGANELGAAGAEGLVHLVGRAAPPVIDGLSRFSQHPERLVHHAVLWYLLTLSLGMSADVIDPDVQAGLALVLPAPGPHLG